MPPRAGTQHAQITLFGLGKHFKSPKHPRDKSQMQRHVEIPGQASKHQCLLE
ncbi:hypothetical protein JVU11DRAFT_10649 [Chiua virens]|nr:hypothetical protein JVU11DRAFT_10649 [Chiua virens]